MPPATPTPTLTATTTTTSTTTTTDVPVSAHAPTTWLITGCSSGLGRELALAALARGDTVIATARRIDVITDLEQRGAHITTLDVTWTDDVVQRTIVDAVTTFSGGHIDVLVNNAGYSLVGGVEESSSQEVFDVFNTNVFGIFKTVKAVLPLMRAQQSGVIANIGSVVGRTSFPAIGAYGASKFAVAGLTESLRAEVAPFGIDVTCIDLGMFRTPFGSNGVMVKHPIAGSSPVVEAMVGRLKSNVGKQPRDPAKAARVIVDALTKSGRCTGQATLPVRLAVGDDTFSFVTAVLARDEMELREWADLVSGTNHDDVIAAT